MNWTQVLNTNNVGQTVWICEPKPCLEALPPGMQQYMCGTNGYGVYTFEWETFQGSQCCILKVEYVRVMNKTHTRVLVETMKFPVTRLWIPIEAISTVSPNS